MHYRAYIYEKDSFFFFFKSHAAIYFEIVTDRKNPFSDPDNLHFVFGIWQLLFPGFLDVILPLNTENVTILVWLTKV